MKKISLKNSFILTLLSLIFGINLIVVSFFTYFNYYKEKKQLQSKIIEITKNLYPVIENYLWQIDLKNLNKLSNILVQSNNEICSIIIFDDENNIVGVEYKKSEWCSKEYIHTISENIFHNNQVIGYVKLTYSSYFIKKSLKNFIITEISFTFLISFILLILISLLFKKLVNEPVNYIVGIFSEIEKGNFNVKLISSKFKEYDFILKSLKKMIKELKFKDTKLNTIINSIPSCIFIFDKNGNYVEVSKGCCELLKLTKDEILSKNVGDFSAEGYTTKKGFNILEKALNTDSYTFEWKFKTKDKKIIEVLGISKKIKFDDEELILFALTDITYVKKLEKEIIEKEKLGILSVIAGGIAHDFNNILTAIEGNVELIKIYIEKNKLEEAQKRLQLLSQSLERAKFLTNQLLTFSKGGAISKPEIIDVKKILKDISDFVLSGTEINVKYDFDENLYPVEIDPEQFGIVIQNLLINSRHALNDRGIIEIKAVNSLDNIEISIKDYGKGIPENIIEKIWEPFFTTKKEGSGLGLSIVKSIITQNKGEIKIYSKEGEFTEVKIILPAYKKISEIKKEKESETVSYKKFEGIKILVLEDEKEIQDTIKDMFEILGIKSDFAFTGEEAIEKFKKEKFNIVLLDLTIKGGMDGKECINYLKKINPEICAIVYSGYYDDPVIKNYKDYGFNYALKKPFKLNDLKKAIENCLK